MKQTFLVRDESAGADVTSVDYDLGDMTQYSISVTFSGADLAGTLTLEASVDKTQWKTITNSDQAVTTATGHIWNVTNAAYRYVRVFWEYTSGTGNITAFMIVKENVVKEN